MCHGHHNDHEDDDGAHDDHDHDQEGRCAMLGTEGGPLLRETEMSRDVGEGSSVKPWGSGSANNLVTLYVGIYKLFVHCDKKRPKLLLSFWYLEA